MPYQLHCWPVATLAATELLTLEELAGIDEAAGAYELTAAFDEAGIDDATDEAAVPPQMLPVITGRSALSPRLSTWMPNETLCPGGILPFHSKFVAE